MAKIIIKRKDSMLGGFQNHDVYFMNTYVGVLKRGGEIEVPVDVGKHTIYFQSRMRKNGKNGVFTAVVNQKDEIVELKTKFDLNGNYVVEYADNKPHIAIVHRHDEVRNDKSLDDENADTAECVPVQRTEGFCCPKCGSNDLIITEETSTKGKNFDAGNACCGWLLLGPIGLLCGAMGKGKQTNSTTYWLCKGCGNKFKA